MLYIIPLCLKAACQNKSTYYAALFPNADSRRTQSQQWIISPPNHIFIPLFPKNKTLSNSKVRYMLYVENGSDVYTIGSYIILQLCILYWMPQ